jgi:hypothetical protein
MRSIWTKLAALFLSAPMLVACSPDFTAKDRRFERRLQEFVADASLGDQSPNATRLLLTDLFGADVFAPDVVYQWSSAEAPIPADNLRDAGSGDLSLDGLVALVGIDGQATGYVRRIWLGGECTDHAGGPVCWPADDELKLAVVEGTPYDAGPHAGRRGRAIQFRRGDQRSCALEPRLR